MTPHLERIKIKFPSVVTALTAMSNITVAAVATSANTHSDTGTTCTNKHVDNNFNYYVHTYT